MQTSNAAIKNKIRDRMQDLKNKIDDADDRAQVAKHSLKEITDKELQLESEKQTKEKKVGQNEKTLVEMKKELDKKLKKMEEIERKQEVEDELVKTLANMEMDGDEKLSELEKQVEKIKNIAESKDIENKEMTLRMAQLENELDKALRRMEDATNKAVKLQESICQGKSRLEDLKVKEEGAYEREDESDKKSIFLAKEVHERVCEAEEKEREVANLERYKEEMNAELNNVKCKVKDVHDEMHKLHDCIDDL